MAALNTFYMWDDLLITDFTVASGALANTEVWVNSFEWQIWMNRTLQATSDGKFERWLNSQNSFMTLKYKNQM